MSNKIEISLELWCLIKTLLKDSKVFKEFIPLVEKQIELDNEIKELTKLKEDKTPLRLI